MLFGARAGFGLECHLERDAHPLCVDVFVGGLQVNTWDNAFYPPLLVKELTDELRRFRTPGARPAGFACDFLEWGSAPTTCGRTPSPTATGSTSPAGCTAIGVRPRVPSRWRR